jgi:hypothetical protein
MSNNRYPEEVLGTDYDDGTMVDNVDTLRQSVVGRRIVSTEKRQVQKYSWSDDPTWTVEAFIITLDDGTQVRLKDTDDCCAFTELESFLLHPDKVDHVIMGVGTTDGYTRWHIYADMGDVLELTVGWSCGNPFYYGYGFDIDVVGVES